MVCGRALQHLPFLSRLLKRKIHVIKNCTDSEIVFLVEIVYNILFNSRLFLTGAEREYLKKQLPILQVISKIRNTDTARQLFLKLDRKTIRALISPVFALECN